MFRYRLIFMNFITVILTLVISININAKEELVNFSIKGSNKLPFNIKITKVKKDYLDTLYVYKEGRQNPIIKHSAKIIGNNLKEAAVLKFNKRVILLTRWNKGAHSEKLLLMDLDKPQNKVIYSYISSWPFSYFIKDNILYIKGIKYKNKAKTIKWKP